MDAVDAASVAAAAAAMRDCDGDDGPGGGPVERRERVLLRPWLENLVNSGVIPGLEWIDAGKTMFKVPWKHRSKKNWSLRHSSVFLEWAKNTGRWKEGDPEPNYAQLKTRLRCAFNKAPDIDEIKALHCTKSEEPYKVYRFTERRDGKSRPLVRMFITKSSRYQAPRRRRRPKNAAAGSSLVATTSSSVAAAAAALCRVQDLKQEPSSEIDGYYGKCLKVEPATNVIGRTFTTQFSELPVTHSSVQLAAEGYNRRNYRMVNAQTAQRILPPPELDGMVSASKWNPPFPVCYEQLSPESRSFADVREHRVSSDEEYSAAAEAVMSAELQSLAAVDETHSKMSHGVDVPRTSYEMHLSSPASAGMSPILPACRDRDPRPTVLPPVQTSEYASAAEETESSDVVGILPSCEDDESVPPLVRFKNRYRRAQQLEEQQQQQHCETLRDFNHNETSKVCEVEMNYSPVEDHRVTENMYYSASPSRILSDPSAVRRSLGEKGHISEETRPPEKRTWSRIILESDLLDPWMSSSKVPYHDATVDSRRIDVDRELKRPENEKLPTKYQQVHQRSLEYQNCIVSCGQPKFSPDGRLDTSRATEMLFSQTAPPFSAPYSAPYSAALNLSRRTVDCEAVDLTTKTMLPATARFVAPIVNVERTHDARDDIQPYECISARDLQQSVDCPASTRSSLAAVDVACVEADFQRKSELIQTKTAVLNDKEHELRLLEQRLMARERVVFWQEHQLDVKNSSKQAAAQSPVEPGSYWQRLKDTDRQQGGKYGGQMNTPEQCAQHHRTQAVIDYRQHVHPPGGAVQVSSNGWAMEKLEEQFAMLAQTRTVDVLPQQPNIGRTKICVQESAEIQPRPEIIPFHSINRHLNAVSQQHGPTRHQFSSAIRKRGRPKGSKNRCKLKPSEQKLPVVGLPVHDQLMHCVYTRGPVMHNNLVVASAAKEAARHGLAQQMIVSYRPSGNGGMVADGCQNTVKMFTGGHLVPGEQPTASYLGPQLSTGPPPQLLLRGHVQSTVPPAVMPARVQQLLASAAFTTGASILPPLSPIHAADFSALAADNAEHPSKPHDLFQRRRNSGDHDAGKDCAYRVVDDSVETNPIKALLVERSMKFPEIQQRHLSDEALSDNLMATVCDPAAAQSGRERSHILPKVSSFDAGQCWSSASLEREEAVHREKGTSNHMSTIRDRSVDDDDDDDDKRLVVVIDGN